MQIQLKSEPLSSAWAVLAFLGGLFQHHLMRFSSMFVNGFSFSNLFNTNGTWLQACVDIFQLCRKLNDVFMMLIFIQHWTIRICSGIEI